MALAAESEPPYPWHLKLKLKIIRFIGAIAQRFGLAVIVALIVMALPATVSADAGHHVITPQVSTVLRGNASGTIYCPAGCGKVYAYTKATNTVTVFTANGSGTQYKTHFNPSAKLDYVTRRAYQDATSAGVDPIKASAWSKGYKSLSAAKAASGLSIGGAGGMELDR